MTWQRIDETTYIDDTLITCAEYKLFVDEMRRQGRDYVPDNWTSRRLKPGQARAPVTSVRGNEVEAFYTWLTKYNSGEWHYRLPTVGEASAYHLLIKPDIPIGYWVTDTDGIVKSFLVGSGLLRKCLKRSNFGQSP